MAMKILSYHFEKLVGDKTYIRADIAVDSASELTSEHGNYVFTAGSIGWDISTGDFYAEDSSGNWHKQGGTVTTTEGE